MKDGPWKQLDLFSPKQPPARIVLAVETNIDPFGNRSDVIVVDEGSVRGVSLLECDNVDALYFNNHSAAPKELR